MTQVPVKCVPLLISWTRTWLWRGRIFAESELLRLERKSHAQKQSIVMIIIILFTRILSSYKESLFAMFIDHYYISEPTKRFISLSENSFKRSGSLYWGNYHQSKYIKERLQLWMKYLYFMIPPPVKLIRFINSINFISRNLAIYNVASFDNSFLLHSDVFINTAKIYAAYVYMANDWFWQKWLIILNWNNKKIEHSNQWMYIRYLILLHKTWNVIIDIRLSLPLLIYFVYV